MITQTLKNKIHKNLEKNTFPIRRLIPNAITLLALCLGLTSLRLGLDREFELAVLCLVSAGFLDGIDGRIARALKGESEMGAQLDSLTDFINFGIAPVFLIYLWGLESLEKYSWSVLLLFSICCALRLARFHVNSDNTQKANWTKKFFIGVPSPVASGLVMFPFYLEFAQIAEMQHQSMLILANIIFIGFLMISRIPTYSGRIISPDIKNTLVLPIMFSIGIFAVSLFTFTWITLVCLSIAYLISLPFSWNSFQKYKKSQE